MREIKGRIKAVGNIKRITKTMQMIATARFQSLQRRATQSQAYTRKIAEMVGQLAATVGGQVSHPLLAGPADRAGGEGDVGGEAAGRELLLVLTSDRGLCGGYNANVLRAAMAFIRERSGSSLDVEVVGKKGAGYFRFNSVPITGHLTQFGDTPKYDEVNTLAERYMNDFIEGVYDGVYVCYMAFHSRSRQTPQVMQLLPMEPPKASDAGDAGGASAGGAELASGGGGGEGVDRAERGVQYDFSPDPQTLLDELLPVTVKTRLFGSFNEAVVSEQLARMVAMKAATDAASDMQKTLKRDFNRARQSAITTELSEIIGGAAALE